MSTEEREVINEGSTSYLTVTFYDKDGGYEAPTTVTYKIWCITNDKEVRAVTSLTPASSIEITLTPTDNSIISQSNALETRLVTIEASYGVDDEINDEYEYDVKNLRKVT